MPVGANAIGSENLARIDGAGPRRCRNCDGSEDNRAQILQRSPRDSVTA
jgi:hypothetical protein